MNEFDLFPDAASSFAGDVDLLYWFLTIVSVIFTVGIAVALLYLGIRYRRKSEDEPAPEEIHGSNLLEIVWSVIPLILAFVMFFWGAHLFLKMRTAPADAMEILVTGKQWMWKLQHPNGKREINNLHVPLGQPIKCTMTSEDVIHSLYFPEFRVKQDVLPGRYTQLWFTPTKIGTYHLFCAEFCGTEHSRMGGKVYVMTPSDYEIWLEGGADASLSPVEAGEQLFTSLGCVTCHHDGKNSQGPHLAGVFGSMQPLDSGEEILADENYIKDSLINPQGRIVRGYPKVMPSFKGMITDAQITQIIAYLKSISGTEEEDSATDEETPESPESALLNDALEPGTTDQRYVRMEQ